jgi:prepilin-type N-terminal cleavage/methylation domain-containing protein
MKRLNTQEGFTLVELAIVMTIIGLLIGGILKGQELMTNARVTAEVAQVKGISAAMTTFKDMFNAAPGDMPNAGTRLVGCPGALGVDCSPLVAVAPNPGAGDGIVGLPTWSAAWGAPGYGVATVGGAPNNVDDERYLFWSHLLLANLIGGVTSDGLATATNYGFDVTNPSIKLGGGFQVGYDNGVIPPGMPAALAGQGLSGTIIVQETGTQLTGALTGLLNNTYALAPLRAAQVDRKMDDGRPATGFVMAFGVIASCFDTNAPYSATSPGYLETVNTTDCGLMFRIEG